MDAAYLDTVLEELADRGFTLTPGLTQEEFGALERTFNLAFPPDLKQFLSLALPLDHKHSVPAFPDWRGDTALLRRRLDWPIDSICFDIEHESFWYPEWGTRPARLEEQIGVARAHLERAPALVPILAHRYIASEPLEEGNPVWSMYQTDIIVYGVTLADYFHQEFSVPTSEEPPERPRRIRFWTDFIEYGCSVW